MSKQVKFNSADDVESVFYEAFQFCDVAVMSAIWSEQDASCVHPGSAAIIGYEAVKRSWSHILGAGGQVNISFQVLHKMQTDDMEVHLVEEKISSATQGTSSVIATNVFKRNTDGWQITSHHGSLVQVPESSTPLQ